MTRHMGLWLHKRGKTKFFYGYVIVLTVFFIFTVLSGVEYSFGVFLKPLTGEFGWTRAEISGAYSVFLLVAGFLYMVTGRLNDRFGPRIVMTVCGFLFGLGYLLMSRITAIWQLYLSYGVIAAIGTSGGLTPLPSTVARWFVRRRGLVTGIAVSGIGVGTIIVPPMASQLIANHGWRTSYLILGIAALALIGLAAQFLKRDPDKLGLLPYGRNQAAAESLDFKAEGASLQQAISTGQFWMLGVMYFCFGFGLIAVLTHIVPHATDLGIPVIIAANILAIIGGASIAGRLGIGIASDRIGNKPSLIISFILLTVALLLLLAIKEQWMFYLFAILFGFAYGSLVVLMSPTVAELFGLRAHGAILGGITCIHFIGCASGTVTAGWIFDITNNYYVAFLVFVALSVISLILASLLTPTGGESTTRKLGYRN